MAVPRWAPTTAYTLGQQIVSPNNDIVTANVAHTSAAAYATDVVKWNGINGAPVTALTGCALIGYGHSYVSGTGASDQAHRFVERLGVLIGAASVSNRGHSGDSMIQTLFEVIGGADVTAWTPNTASLVVLDSVLNDVLHTTLTSAPQDLIGFTNALRTILRVLRTSQYVPGGDASITYAGATWTLPVPTGSRLGQCRTTSTIGATATIAGYIPTEITIMVYGMCAAWSPSSTFDVIVGSTVYGGTLLTSDVSSADTSGVNPAGYQLNAYRVTGLPSGSKSVVVTNRGGGNNSFFFDGYLYPASTAPPSIVVIQDGELASYPALPFTTAQGNDLLAGHNAVVASVLAEPEWGGDPYVRVVHAGEGYTNVTMMYSDVWHRNDSGHEALAQTIFRTAVRMPYRSGLH